MQTGIKMQVCDCALRSSTAVAWNAKIMVQRALLCHRVLPAFISFYQASMHNASSVHMSK